MSDPTTTNIDDLMLQSNTHAYSFVNPEGLDETS